MSRSAASQYEPTALSQARLQEKTMNGLYPIIRRKRRPLTVQEPIAAPPVPAHEETVNRGNGESANVGDGGVAVTKPASEAKDQSAEDCKY
jgi:hypothetical protein